MAMCQSFRETNDVSTSLSPSDRRRDERWDEDGVIMWIGGDETIVLRDSDGRGPRWTTVGLM